MKRVGPAPRARWNWRAIWIAAGALLVAAIGFTYYHYRQDVDAARARIATGSKIAQTLCGAIEYADAGSGPAVLVVHGAGGGFDQGMLFAPMLNEAGYRVIAPSRFGYLGARLPDDASPMAQADDHACLLDALNVKRVVIIGVSAGAPSTMQFCLRHPQRCAAMVLLVPLAFSPDTVEQTPARVTPTTEAIINFLLRSDFIFWSGITLAPDTMTRTILGTPPADVHRAPPDEQARMRDMLHAILPIAERATGLWNESKVVAAMKRYDLERIAAPTLIVSVENDLYGTYRSSRYTADHIPGARFVGYPTGGHMWVEHQQDVWSELREFLRVHRAP
jgi:2-hydroxy-6-oxonona-2,4-dienedioate hydrolase